MLLIIGILKEKNTLVSIEDVRVSYGKYIMHR